MTAEIPGVVSFIWVSERQEEAPSKMPKAISMPLKCFLQFLFLNEWALNKKVEKSANNAFI